MEVWMGAGMVARGSIGIGCVVTGWADSVATASVGLGFFTVASYALLGGCGGGNTAVVVLGGWYGVLSCCVRLGAGGTTAVAAGSCGAGSAFAALGAGGGTIVDWTGAGCVV